MKAPLRPHINTESKNYVGLLSESFERWTGRVLRVEMCAPDITDLAEAFYNAACPLVSHGMQADPVFRYGNRAALALFDTDWESFTQMPSRLSAAPIGDIQNDRNALLKAAMQKGWIEDYSGERVSRTGHRFMIENTILWNVVDADGIQHGQAALIKKWSPL